MKSISIIISEKKSLNVQSMFFSCTRGCQCFQQLPKEKKENPLRLIFLLLKNFLLPFSILFKGSFFLRYFFKKMGGDDHASSLCCSYCEALSQISVSIGKLTMGKPHETLQCRKNAVNIALCALVIQKIKSKF